MKSKSDAKSLAVRVAKAKLVDGGQPKLLGIEEAAARLRIGMSLMRKLVREKKIRSVLIGRARRVIVASLDDYITELEMKS